jgi:hypothetical protein
MNEETKNEILAAIEKDLPNQIGTLLKKRLELVEKLDAKVLALEEDIEEYEKRIKNQKEMLDKHESLDTKRIQLENLENDLEILSKSIQDKEKYLRTHEAELLQQEAEKRADQAVEIVKLVFRSPVYNKRIVENKQDIISNQYNQDTGQYSDKKTGEDVVKTETITES